jgi:hypothetical protein
MPSRRRVPPPVKKNRGTTPPNALLRKRRRSNAHALIRARLWRHNQKAPVHDRAIINDKSSTTLLPNVAMHPCLTRPPRTLPTSEPPIIMQLYTACVNPINPHALFKRLLASTLLQLHLRHSLVVLAITALSATNLALSILLWLSANYCISAATYSGLHSLCYSKVESRSFFANSPTSSSTVDPVLPASKSPSSRTSLYLRSLGGSYAAHSSSQC